MKFPSYLSFQFLTLAVAGCFTLSAQTPGDPKLAADQPGCVDSKYFPKLLECRIDNCEKKDADHREIPLGEDEKGEPVKSVIDGLSRSVMYECREGTAPASIVERAADALKTGGFEIPYRFADAEASLTARKNDLFVTVDAAAQYYTVTEITSSTPDYDAIEDAESMFDMMDSSAEDSAVGEAAASLPNVPRWTNTEQLKFEKEALDFYFSSHPILLLKQKTNYRCNPLVTSSALNANVKCAVMVERVKPYRTKTGQMMAFISVSDESAFLDLVVMPNLYDKTQAIWVKGNLLEIEGTIEQENSCMVRNARQIGN